MAKNININFLVDKENERVVVSNEKGTMDIREYQDNIREVLIKEDIVKELESDYSVFKSNRTSFEGRLEDTNKEIKNTMNQRKTRKKIYFGFIVLAPILVYSICTIAGIPFEISLFFGVGTELIYDIMVLLFVKDVNRQRKNLEQKKEEYEIYIQELDLKIADLVQVMTKNKAELQELIDQKESNNIEMWPTEIQKIFYREALEFEKLYLTQLLEENTIVNPEEKDAKVSILGRFKKKKQY